MRLCALTIAGSDSSGGAGIQADLKTFHQLGVYGASAITCLTAQNTSGVQGIFPVDPDFVAQQIRAVYSDINVAAVKTGMLYSAPIIKAVGHALIEARAHKLVVDPVMVATSGDALLEHDALSAYTEYIFPHALLITPNTHEASILCGAAVKSREDMQEAAIRIADHGAEAVLVKGGHLEGEPKACDLLYYKGEFHWFEEKLIESDREFHGSGCTLSAAICAFLAGGRDLVEACRAAKRFIHHAIKGAYAAGKGALVLDHWAAP